MAIIPSTSYPTQIDTTDLAYPLGKAQNISAPSAGDGTPWEALAINDHFGFQQALLAAASIVASGVPDEVGASQYLQALQALFEPVFSKNTGFNLDLGTVAGTVAEGDDARFPTVPEKAAMTNASTPTGANPFATLADIPAIGAALNVNNLLHLRDEKTNNTAAQTLLAASGWQTRDINTIKYNGSGIGGSPLSSNQVTLPAGTWVAEIQAGAYTVGANKLRLQNVTDGTTVEIGLNGADANASNTSPAVFLNTAPFVIGAAKTFEIQHNVAADGFGGFTNNFSVVEVYLDVKFWKVG